MPKPRKPSSKSEPPSSNAEGPNIVIGGNVTNSNIVIGDNNTLSIQSGRPLLSAEQLGIVPPTIVTTLFTIPSPISDFTGRAHELEELKSNFLHGALITGVSGGGGVGKTELARKLANEIKDHYPDAWMEINLQGTSESPLTPDEAMRRLLEPFYTAQKLPDDSTQLKSLFQQTFTSQRALLLLDNAANAPQVRSLIPPAPSAVIITSRQHFSLTEFGLKKPLRLDVLSLENSCKLLRAACDKLGEAADQEVNELAKLCGNLPLALRVAASLLNDRSDWTLAILLHSLGDERTRLQRLKRPDDIDLDVEAVIGLSYNLLPDESKKHLRMLSIFQDEFWNISVSKILGIDQREDADRILDILVARSLLNVQPSQFQQVGGTDIIDGFVYDFHDLTRLFASVRLREQVEEARLAVERHADFFLSLAELAKNVYKLGDMHIQVSLSLFRGISPDLFLAWQRMQPNQKDWPRPDSADDWLVSFPFSCGDVFELQVSVHERVRILQVAIEALRIREAKRGETEPTETKEPPDSGAVLIPLEVAFLNNLGDAYIEMGEARKAISLLDDAMTGLDAADLNSELSYNYGKASIFGNKGNAYYLLKDVDKASECWGQQLDIAREISDYRSQSSALGNLGNAYSEGGDLLLGLGYYQKQLNLARELGLKRDEGDALGNIGVTYWKWGEIKKS